MMICPVCKGDMLREGDSLVCVVCGKEIRTHYDVSKGHQLDVTTENTEGVRMKQHELKIMPQYFQDVWDGTKTFELRKDDRGYQQGDILVLREWDGKKFTGSMICVKVTYILRDAEKYGLKDGYIVMGIKHLSADDWRNEE